MFSPPVILFHFVLSARTRSTLPFGVDRLFFPHSSLCSMRKSQESQIWFGYVWIQNWLTIKFGQVTNNFHSIHQLHQVLCMDSLCWIQQSLVLRFTLALPLNSQTTRLNPNMCIKSCSRLNHRDMNVCVTVQQGWDGWHFIAYARCSTSLARFCSTLTC